MPSPRSILFEPGRDGGQGSMFHCISRVVDRRFVLGPREKDQFRRLLRRVEAFSGVQVVTWAVLDNHFHVLVHIPPRPEKPYTESEILSRVRRLYSRQEVAQLEEGLERLRRSNGGGEAGDEAVLRHLQRFVRRMHDLSEFMKTMKQRFTRWFNRRHRRVGYLWESRFKSVLVDGALGTAIKIAAYIDLNAVRAGLVRDPAEYRWCGYGEAVAGRGRAARRGIRFLLSQDGGSADWRSAGPAYRCFLFGIGEEGGESDETQTVRKGISQEDVREAWETGGAMPAHLLLRCRVRYFTDGLVIGSRTFVETWFERKRRWFGPNRATGARRLKGGDWGDLFALRDLQARPIDYPDTGSKRSPRREG